MMYAAGVVTMMMAGAAMGPTRSAAEPVPRKNGRDLLFDSKFFEYPAEYEPKTTAKTTTTTKEADHGYVGAVYDHFSNFKGYAHDPDAHTSEDDFVKDHGSASSYASCSSYASAHAYEESMNAHVGVVEYAILEFCKPDWDGTLKHVHDYAEAHAGAVAKAVTASQADCVSEGNAFGCASATAAAEAWASAKAEAHAYAAASAYDKCQEQYHCPIDAAALSVAQASTFIEMTVDVFSRSEVYACSEGDSSAWAAAYSKCAAVAYAKVWTEALAKAYLDTGCAKSDAAAQVEVETNAEWYTIEGCQRGGDSADYGYGGTADFTTSGSGAHAYADEVFPHY